MALARWNPTADVEADYSNGILTLRLPKVEDAVNRKVKINLGGQSQQAIAGSQQS